MNDTLRWSARGEIFEDGSRFSDWIKVEEAGIWHWQYDTHEMTFDIYRHDGQFWKLYLIRTTTEDGEYEYDFGGQACRMVLVSYKKNARSPHSNRAMKVSDLEWIRTYEYDPSLHTVVRAGDENAKYEPPFGTRSAA